MASGKTHPHIDRPTCDQLREAVGRVSPDMLQSYLDVHELVTETLPDVNYAVDLKDAEIGYGVRQYGYGGWGMAALAPHAGWVSLAFLRGALLDDPAGVLEGSGRLVRHVKVRSAEQLARLAEPIRALLIAATRQYAG